MEKKKSKSVAGDWSPVETGAPVAWEAGVVVTGYYVKTADSSFIQDDGSPAKHLILRDAETGEETTYRCPAVLLRKISALEPGSEVMIKCDGKIRTKSNRQAWGFSVFTR